MTEFTSASGNPAAQQIMVNSSGNQPTFLINGPNGKLHVIPATGAPITQTQPTVLISNGGHEHGTVLYQPLIDQSAANGGASNVFSAALLQQLLQQTQQGQAITVPSQAGGNIVMVLNQGGTATPIQIGQTIASPAPLQIQGGIVTQASASPALTAATHTITAEAEEEPLYVNAKQYNRILKRRADRARLEAQGKIPRERRRYLHESRHRHAMNRVRGEGGRFHSGQGKDDTAEGGSGTSDPSGGGEGQQCLNEYFSQIPNKYIEGLAAVSNRQT